MPPKHQAAVLEITVVDCSSTTSNLAVQTTVPSPRPVGVSLFRGKSPDAEMYLQEVCKVVKLRLPKIGSETSTGQESAKKCASKSPLLTNRFFEPRLTYFWGAVPSYSLRPGV
jgi:hypothetical protein